LKKNTAHIAAGDRANLPIYYLAGNLLAKARRRYGSRKFSFLKGHCLNRRLAFEIIDVEQRFCEFEKTEPLREQVETPDHFGVVQ
jgi:hypothetical protein